MLTAVVPYTGNLQRFLETIKSFLVQKFTADVKRIDQLPQLIVLNMTTEDLQAAETEGLLRRFRSLITLVDCPDLTLPAAYNQAVKLATRDYITFALPGDMFPVGSLAKACVFFKTQTKLVSFISLNTACLFRDTEKFDLIFRKDSPALIELNEHPDLVPIVFSGIILKKACFDSSSFNESLEYDFGLDFIYRLLKSNPKFGFAKTAAFRTTNSLESTEVGSTFALRAEWYWQTTRDFLIPLFKNHVYSDGTLPKYLQHAATYQLKWRFQHNINTNSKHVIDEEVETFFELCGNLLNQIDADIITTKSKFFTLTQFIKYTFLHLKYKDQYTPKYFYYEGNTFLEQDNTVLFKANDQKVLLELLEYDEENLIIEASIDNFVDLTKCRLLAFYAKEPLIVQETYRYAHAKYFSVSVHKRHTFKVAIPKQKLLSTPGAIAFKLKIDGHLVDLSIITKRHTSRLSSSLPKTYWASSGFVLRLATNKKTISVKKATLTTRIKAEYALLSNMLFSNKCPTQLFTLRCLYWLSYPFFSRSRIWLTYDKLYKAGDCGEYFYKHAVTRKDGISAAYVLNETSPDYARLRSEGYRPLKYGTLKHKLHFLHAEAIFTTHGGVHSFNSFTDSDIIYFQNLLRADVACIQHGLTVQQLAFNSNRLFNNMKRYYCASKYEIQNLAHPVYGYEDKSALKLTGIPRYDGLVNQDKKQILITPTWRNYIAMPATAKNESKPYYPGFKNTDYFKIYNSLLSDARLIETAKATGYKIIYLLHPTVSAQIDDYPKRDGIEIIPSLSINYEEILTESSLMVTDYSGVQFDFAYMRKPVVYYHPPKLPPHYKEGGFFYDTMGFGEICTEHDELVNNICSYMLDNCNVKPFYLARQNDFFAHSDLDSSKRIYDDMLDYQKTKTKAFKPAPSDSATNCVQD
ncbi:CDP-Glycerol:Poly(glycerophosphate) glycerophosphotransferase [Pseudomonas sp. ok272]|uniref:CDP-glycerol glycerophosphotransferase family protein n=1 Tax=Pseudomonas sp. ok272 TaxID=1761897 RepID=UPI0008BD6495|nr:CDP-glycerol glycerophosphotransferase family protein [Pseudomonas sp. ok272]SEM99386.1 CDP-Glycerol:Poly(glycerophosphate) glycerophosphotransferase [Pseudomonas sp. ok272]